MHPKRFALVFGIVLFVTGVLSFLPGLYSIPAEGLPPMNIESSYGLFLGLFAMNSVNKIAALALGLGGIWAATRPTTNLPASISYSRLIFAVMGALSILGMLTTTNTLFGYWPLWGNNVWIAGIFSLAGAYFGYALSSRVPKQPDVSKRTPVHGT